MDEQTPKKYDKASIALICAIVAVLIGGIVGVLLIINSQKPAKSTPAPAPVVANDSKDDEEGDEDEEEEPVQSTDDAETPAPATPADGGDNSAEADKARQEVVQTVVSAIMQYQSNNRGKIPSLGGVVTGGLMESEIKVDNIPLNDQTNVSTSWGYFYANYLLVGYGGGTTHFVDPDGIPYNLVIIECKNKTGNCNTNYVKNSMNAYETGLGQVSYAINIITHATCDGVNPVYSSSTRKLAVRYKPVNGNFVCVNN
ncbi:MAG: hypothetical protein Q4E47_01025 [Candidatus Saccharibacteria bacterium]|nr:hypothetical protein [Candidatus Saccharibacteria bacterium]